jgi:hypothetical protein
MVDSNKLSREFLAERDARIFGLKKSGLSNQEIARRFDMTAASVAAATRRQLGRLNSEAFLSYPEVLRLELERLDELQKGLWPLTQFRREVLDDGSEVMLEPDQNAVRTVLGIMDRRAKLLGMNVERAVVELQMDGGGGDTIDVRSSLAGAAGGEVLESGEAAKAESLQLLELMASSGVLDDGVVSDILSNVEERGGLEEERVVLDDLDVVDAEIVDESEDL